MKLTMYEVGEILDSRYRQIRGGCTAFKELPDRIDAVIDVLFAYKKETIKLLKKDNKKENK